MIGRENRFDAGDARTAHHSRDIKKNGRLIPPFLLEHRVLYQRFGTKGTRNNETMPRASPKTALMLFAWEALRTMPYGEETRPGVEQRSTGFGGVVKEEAVARRQREPRKIGRHQSIGPAPELEVSEREENWNWWPKFQRAERVVVESTTPMAKFPVRTATATSYLYPCFFLLLSLPDGKYRPVMFLH